MGRLTPVIHEDSGPARKRTASAMSSTWPDPGDRHARDVVVQQRAPGGDERHELVVDDARLHAVDPDAVGTQLLRGALAEHVDAGLRGPVGPQVAVGEGAGARRHADDRAAPVRAHRSHGVLDRQHGADQVDVDGGTQGLGVRVGERPHVERSAGVGEEDAQAAGGLGGEGHGGGDLLLDGHVGHDVTDRAALTDRRRDLLDRCHELVLGATADRDVCAVGGQADGRPEPDAAASAGDECGHAGDRGRGHGGLRSVGSMRGALRGGLPSVEVGE